MKTLAEIFEDVQSISRKELTSIKKVKRTAKSMAVRISDINGDIYIGIDNGSFYHYQYGVIHKLD